jgi:hypothetical protein
MKFYPKTTNHTSDFQKGFYLWILKVDKVPPHLILSYQGKYYNLSVYGRFMSQPLEALLKTIIQKKIQTLILSLKDFDDLEEKIKDSYHKFEKVEAPYITCLSPIKELFEKYKYSGAISTIHDLLPLLEKNDVITSSYGINIKLNENDKSFELPFYTINDVYQCIDELNTEKHVTGK